MYTERWLISNIPTVSLKIRFSKFHSLIIKPGSVSDDTKMSLALLRSLLSNDLKYDRDTVLINYMKWANSESMIGRNTRRLLKGVTTVR